jgi:phosphonate transport system substrate-binding protein
MMRSFLRGVVLACLTFTTLMWISPGDTAPAGQASPSPLAATPEPTRTGLLAKAFNIGYLSERVEISAARMAPAMKLFRAGLAPYGVTSVNLKVSPSMEEIADWLRTGKIDLFASSPYPAVRIAALAQHTPVLQATALRPPRTLFVVRSDSPIQSIGALDGKRMALTYAYSTPGYFIPLLHLSDRGFGFDRPGSGGKLVHTSLSGHTMNSLYWVYFGKADVAAVSEEEFQHQSGTLRAALRILDRSEAYPGFLMSVSPVLSKEQQKVITDYMTSMHKQPEGRQMLENFYGCTCLELIPPAVAEWIRQADAAIRKIPRDAGPDKSLR